MAEHPHAEESRRYSDEGRGLLATPGHSPNPSITGESFEMSDVGSPELSVHPSAATRPSRQRVNARRVRNGSATVIIPGPDTGLLTWVQDLQRIEPSSVTGH